MVDLWIHVTWWKLISSEIHWNRFENEDIAWQWDSMTQVATPLSTRLRWFKRRVVEIWIQGKLKSCTSQGVAGDDVLATVLQTLTVSICKWWGSHWPRLHVIPVIPTCSSVMLLKYTLMICIHVQNSKNNHSNNIDSLNSCRIEF